jgi:hypothetical protein
MNGSGGGEIQVEILKPLLLIQLRPEILPILKATR